MRIRYRLDPRIEAIEKYFDADRIRDPRAAALWPAAVEMIIAYEESRWSDAYRGAWELFASAESIQVQAFALQWAIAASEIEYDLVRRARYLRRWDEIVGWESDPYCRYLHAYQTGLTHFFNASLRDALGAFREAHRCCERIDHPRGLIRMLFHLGLVERDRECHSAALEHFYQALALAAERKATRTAGRIEIEIAALRSKCAAPTSIVDESIAAMKLELEELLRGRRFSEARQVLGRAELKRRSSRMRRSRESLGIYLSLIHLSRGRTRLGERLLSRIQDPPLKIRALELKRAAFGPNATDEERLASLRAANGISAVRVPITAIADPDSVEICGTRLGSVRQAEVKVLLLFLLEQGKPVTKEDIFARVWRGTYDPSEHDRRIYKLVQKAKDAFGRSDLFLNTYGAYEINPTLLGKSASA